MAGQPTRDLRAFLAGALCFTVTQPLMRIPLLQALQQSTDFSLQLTLHPLITGLLIALSAGLFEEGGRFLFKALLLRPPAAPLRQPLLFGLGHGLAEVLWLLLPVLGYSGTVNWFWVILERMLAVWLHLGLSVVVFAGFQRGYRLLHLLLAILIHGAANALIPLFQLQGIPLNWLYLPLFAINLALTGWVLKTHRSCFQEVSS